MPVIFLSSAADNLNIVMAMNMGGDDFIAKPFDQGRADGQGAGHAAAQLMISAAARRCWSIGGWR